MKLKRLADLNHNERRKIEARQNAGTMKKYADNKGYLCYDEIELAKYVPRKVGRPIEKSKPNK